MKLSEIPTSNFLRDLRDRGVWLRTGPFRTHVQSSIAALGQALHLLYGDFPLEELDDFADFHVRLMPKSIRRFYHPQVHFSLDDHAPFKPLPLSHAFAMFEWCMNWCIESQTNHYLMMHAAIIERDGSAAILGAPPGAGKSTLTAGLVNRGWRLLSDELTLIDPVDGLAVPLARPVSLKNQSIDIIRDFAPGATIGPIARDTIKGSVAHLRPPAESVQRAEERAMPRWVIFPKFEAGVPASLVEYPKSPALVRLADHAFNYSQYGVKGFEMLVQLIDKCDCFEFTYSRLADAVDVFDSLSARHTITMA